MNFLRNFISRILEAIEEKILSNPLSFSSVTGFFIITLYLIWIENNELGFSIQEYIAYGIAYIITLTVFMDRATSSSQKRSNNRGDNINIKQNSISLFSVFKNIKK